MNTRYDRSLPNNELPCNLDIHVQGQLFSNEMVQLLVKDLVVPLLAKQLLADEVVQQALRAVRTPQHPRVERTPRLNRNLLTINEAAEHLGIRPSTVRAWIGSRKIPMVKVGRCVRVPMEAVNRFIEANTVPAR
jgi:excisionase family DNA binding protein